jgi:hypothetical protein
LIKEIMSEDHIDESWKASKPFEPSQQFDFDSLDDAKANFVAELIRHPGDLDESLREVGSEFFHRYGSSVVVRFLALVCQSRNPRLCCKVLCYAAGMTTQSLAEIADEEKISKQAVQQMAEKYADELDLPKCPAMRSEDARQNMAASYNERRVKD